MNRTAPADSRALPVRRTTLNRYRIRDVMPLLLMHLGCLLVFVYGVSAAALVAAAVTYLVRVFALTAGYHRYFSHRSFRTTRWFQFVLGFVGATSAQLDPLWWASHHRWHHKYADTERDIHSPARHGFWWAHIGWILSHRYTDTRMDLVKDLAKYPELRWLNRRPYLPAVLYGIAMFLLGWALAVARPGWGTSGMQMFTWTFFVGTVAVYHVTFSINSLMHMFGSRPYETRDTSRNSFLLALITMGEGWHNNHHRYPASTRQGFRWWELDLTWYLLWLMSRVHLVWDLKAPPQTVLRAARAR